MRRIRTRGATGTEVIIIIVLVAIVCLLAVTILGNTNKDMGAASAATVRAGGKVGSTSAGDEGGGTEPGGGDSAGGGPGGPGGPGGSLGGPSTGVNPDGTGTSGDSSGDESPGDEGMTWTDQLVWDYFITPLFGDVPPDQDVFFGLGAEGGAGIVIGGTLGVEGIIKFTKDGKIQIIRTVSAEGGAGVGVGGNAEFHVGGKDYGLGAGAGVDGKHTASVTQTLEFDPNTPGDMTLLMELLMGNDQNPDLKDKMVQVSGEVGSYIDAEVDVDVAWEFLKGGVGGGKAQYVQGDKNDSKTWDVTYGTKYDVHGDVTWPNTVFGDDWTQGSENTSHTYTTDVSGTFPPGSDKPSKLTLSIEQGIGDDGWTHSTTTSKTVTIEVSGDANIAVIQPLMDAYAENPSPQNLEALMAEMSKRGTAEKSTTTVDTSGVGGSGSVTLGAEVDVNGGFSGMKGTTTYETE